MLVHYNVRIIDSLYVVSCIFVFGWGPGGGLWASIAADAVRMLQVATPLPPHGYHKRALRASIAFSAQYAKDGNNEIFGGLFFEFSIID